MSGREVDHSHLVPKIRMHGTIHLLSHTSTWYSNSLNTQSFTSLMSKYVHT